MARVTEVVPRPEAEGREAVCGRPRAGRPLGVRCRSPTCSRTRSSPASPSAAAAARVVRYRPRTGRDPPMAPLVRAAGVLVALVGLLSRRAAPCFSRRGARSRPQPSFVSRPVSRVRNPLLRGPGLALTASRWRSVSAALPGRVATRRRPLWVVVVEEPRCEYASGRHTRRPEMVPLAAATVPASPDTPRSIPSAPSARRRSDFGSTSRPGASRGRRSTGRTVNGVHANSRCETPNSRRVFGFDGTSTSRTSGRVSATRSRVAIHATASRLDPSMVRKSCAVRASGLAVRTS